MALFSEFPSDPFQLLGVPQGAPPEEIESAYLRRREEIFQRFLAEYGLLPLSERDRELEELEIAYRIAMKKGGEASASTSEIPETQPLSEPSPSSPPPQPYEESTTSSWEKRLWDGSFLKAIRLSRNLPIELISQTLKISRTQIEALENHRYHLLPPLVYIKGFLRAYAKFLKIDPERLVRDYLSRWQGDSERK